MATTITLDDVKKARVYMPVETKEAVARLFAKIIVQIVPNDAAKTTFPLPDLRVENRVRRLQCLHGVLCGWYFGADFEKETLKYKTDTGETEGKEIAFCMSVAALDKWLEGHPMNQLERLKKEKAVANKIYDLLYDFKAFEMTLNGAIREELEMQNDPALRMALILSVQTTPESVKEMMAALDEMKKAVGGGENAR